MVILYNKFDETLEYAVAELTKYVEKMSGFTVFPVSRHVFEMPKENIEGTVKLGLLSDFELSTEGVEDEFLDDVIDINIDGFTGYIAGSNIRSILLGVYKYLHSCGARWVRPGDDAEYLPHCDFKAHSFKYRHAASCRFRGECIEGAVTYENVRDHVIWSPKVGYNLFFIQQIVPFNIMSRRYFRKYNPLKSPDERTFEEMAEYTREIELTAKKCGLQLHLMGHGFMFEPYGIHYKTGQDTYELSDLAISHSALVGGKRGLFHGSPNFTQLCFSNEDARRGMVNFLIEYIERKPYCDFLQVWLADSLNNHCECDECRKTTPSDFYVMILNELDSELTKRGLDTRIVFIMYTDTIFPPEKEKLINPKRFTLLSAFSRSYSLPYSDEPYDKELPVYCRNNYNVPSDFRVANAFLKEWRRQFDGDAVIFTYYFYTAQFSDPGLMAMPRVIAEDSRRLKELGFAGTISCHTQRCSFPNAFPSMVFAESHYDTGFDYDAFAEDYFKACYGEEWMAAKAYLDKLTELLDEKLIRTTTSVVEEDTGLFVKKAVDPWKNNPEAKAKFVQVRPLIDSFMPMIERMTEKCGNACHKKSWKYLEYYSTYMAMLSDALMAGADGDSEKCLELGQALFNRMRLDEDEWESDLDLMLFINAWTPKLK